MYNLSTEMPLILTVSFNNRFKVWRNLVTLSVQVKVRFNKKTKPLFIWKGKCYIADNQEVIWKFSQNCPYLLIQKVKKLYPDDKILKIYKEMLMLSNL